MGIGGSERKRGKREEEKIRDIKIMYVHVFQIGLGALDKVSSIIAAHIQLWRRVNQTWAALKPLGSHYNDDIQNRVSEFCCTKKTPDLTLNIYVLLSIFKLAVNFF